MANITYSLISAISLLLLIGFALSLELSHLSTQSLPGEHFSRAVTSFLTGLPLLARQNTNTNVNNSTLNVSDGGSSNSGGGGGLSTSDKIALGVGLGVGIPSLIAGVAAVVYARRQSRQSRHRAGPDMTYRQGVPLGY